MRSEFRSRQGCVECRRRHRKCDESKPNCIACQQRRISCNYPAQFRWEEVTEPEISAQAERRAAAKARQSSKKKIKSTISIHSHSGPSSKHEDPRQTERLQELSLEQPEDEVTREVMLQHLDSPAETAIPDTESPESSRSFRQSMQVFESEIHWSRGQLDAYFQTEDDNDRSSTISEGWILNDDMFNNELQNHIAGFETPGDALAFVYYCNHLCEILQARDDGIDNPYRSIALLGLRHPVLLYTIISCATQYMYCHGRVPTEIAVSRHQRAIRSLRNALSHLPYSQGPNTGDVDDLQALLAAVLLQVAQSAFRNGTDAYEHLRAAHHLLILENCIHDVPQKFTPTTRFLVQRFAILDVATSVLHRRRPFIPLSSWLCNMDSDLDATQPSFLNMTGCPHKIFVFLARIMHLEADLTEKCKPQDEIIDSIYALEFDLGQLRQFYGIRTSSTDQEDMTTPSDALDILSQCFFWMAVLLIHRRLHHDSCIFPRIQNIVAVQVRLMKAIPPKSDVNSALSLPFFLTAREIIAEDDRNWVRERHQAAWSSYPNPARMAMMNLTEDIWKRVDEALVQNSHLLTGLQNLQDDVSHLEMGTQCFVI